MDRRQRKTREAIFKAFTDLLSEKDVQQITVGEIIDRADVGRATFYSHFETKDFLIKELCEELFCHIGDYIGETVCNHHHIFECEDTGSAYLHLLKHLMKNDNHILKLLSCRNNEIFLRYFKTGLKDMVKRQIDIFKTEETKGLPEDFIVNHITATFVETVKWWVDNRMEQSPEVMEQYFFKVVKRKC